MKIIRHVPKRSWKESALTVLRRYRGNYILNVRYLIDKTISLRDAEAQKALLYGKGYLDSFESACNNLQIAINDLKISIHEQIIKKIT